MYSVRHTKYHSLYRRSERGFVLIAALMAVMVLMAVGFFILTTTSQDVKISSRLVGERKAFSAAEAGVNEICRTLELAGIPSPGQKVDATRDPSAEFEVTPPLIYSRGIVLPGEAIGTKAQIYRSTVTGRDTSYKSEVKINVGIIDAGGRGDPTQGDL